MVTVGNVILGRDTLLDLERKIGKDYEIRKSVWGAELIYTLDVIYRAGGEGWAALSFTFDLTASDRAEPPDWYSDFLRKVDVAIKEKSMSELKRLLGKRKAYIVGVKPYLDIDSEYTDEE